MIPFVLRGRRTLPPESPPGSDVVYDEQLQLWVNSITGVPLVSEHVIANRDERLSASQFGETINTRTQEGVDQTERIRGSDLGETVVTKTQEGIDTTERAVSDLAAQACSSRSLTSSKFGETILTATREGVDQTEGSS